PLPQLSPLFPLVLSSTESPTFLPVSRVSHASSTRSSIRCCVCLISSFSSLMDCNSATTPSSFVGNGFLSPVRTTSSPSPVKCCGSVNGTFSPSMDFQCIRGNSAIYSSTPYKYLFSNLTFVSNVSSGYTNISLVPLCNGKNVPPKFFKSSRGSPLINISSSSWSNVTRSPG